MPAVEFRKQPLSPAPGSDSDFMSSDGQEHPKPISLLSSMMGGQTSPRSKQYLSGSTSGPSAPSTAPSTTFSSPRPQEEPISILRRSSVGSDGEPFLLPMARALPTSPDKQEIKQPRLSSLKFAVTSRPSGFEPQPMTTVPQHDDLEDDRGTVTDKGYEEDSEDGFTSDDEPSFVMQAHHKMAMARAREAQLTAARPTSASPPLRPTAPPPRCGRGHVRVDPAVGDDTGRCSRHYSPPPDTRQRSAPPGPRNGRAGSPVPDPMDIDDEDDDDDDDDGEENDNEGAARKRDSSREDITSTSPGASPSPRPTTQQSAGPPSSIGTGVRNMLRRASEHLPSFRRPSFTAPISEELVTLDDDDDSIDSGRVLLSRARSLGARTKPTAVTLSQDNATAIPSRPIACPTSPRSTPRT
ncbi:hypothetical protein CspeluHIS016_0901660 [Cutaneotrichosporon spelunceum]|uniref:Uncharacterized protein n=1 Tax=Cutaneotrichosporon spelunceum TaxID=1672016 RepID=A0AAD3YFC3_9TREE|nr:hypothetical protein CspeluHIS016_0901660 [Cutaneotrichosporon spelunceum]